MLNCPEIRVKQLRDQGETDRVIGGGGGTLEQAGRERVWGGQAFKTERNFIVDWVERDRKSVV